VKTFNFDQVTSRAFDQLMQTLKTHGVEFFSSRSGTETLGTFRSEAGAGTFAYDGRTLTVTITHDSGHFSPLMIKGGLRQLVEEAREIV